jgi:hypothetical protein
VVLNNSFIFETDLSQGENSLIIIEEVLWAPEPVWIRKQREKLFHQDLNPVDL